MNPILQPQTNDFVSIGEDPQILLAFKVHAGLPSAVTWTEADFQLKSLLAAAEKTVDKLTHCPQQSRTFEYRLDNLCRSSRRYSIKLPVYPIDISAPISVEWTGNDSDGNYQLHTDFEVYGELTLSPEIIFNSSFAPPTTSDIVYPYRVLFTAGPCRDKEVSRMAIFELAAHYYRNPESMSDEKPDAGCLYMANLDLIANNFL